jgi:hypothetical protein
VVPECRKSGAGGVQERLGRVMCLFFCTYLLLPLTDSQEPSRQGMCAPCGSDTRGRVSELLDPSPTTATPTRLRHMPSHHDSRAQQHSRKRCSECMPSLAADGARISLRQRSRTSCCALFEESHKYRHHFEVCARAHKVTHTHCSPPPPTEHFSSTAYQPRSNMRSQEHHDASMAAQKATRWFVLTSNSQ